MDQDKLAIVTMCGLLLAALFLATQPTFWLFSMALLAIGCAISAVVFLVLLQIGPALCLAILAGLAFAIASVAAEVRMKQADQKANLAAKAADLRAKNAVKEAKVIAQRKATQEANVSAQRIADDNERLSKTTRASGDNISGRSDFSILVTFAVCAILFTAVICGITFMSPRKSAAAIRTAKAVDPYEGIAVAAPAMGSATSDPYAGIAVAAPADKNFQLPTNHQSNR